MKKFRFKRIIGSAILRFSGYLAYVFADEKKKKMPFVRIVNYHEVFPADFANFQKQIMWLTKHYQLISLEELRLFLRGGLSLSKPGLLLTFDDGLESNYSILFPFLKKTNTPAVFFICPGLIGANGYMDVPQILECTQSGLVEIGSHTISHAALKEELTVEKTRFEICESKSRLEELIGKTIDCFCWPIGANDCYSVESFRCFLKTRYEYGFTTYSEQCLPDMNKVLLPRTNIQTYWSISEMAFQMSKIHDRRFLERKQIIMSHYSLAKGDQR